MHPYNRSLVENAQKLRKEMTPEEKKLWYDLLKRLPLTVRRQHNIENYIVDFYIASKNIVIEVDGLQHLSEEGKAHDEFRDKSLAEWGIKTLRYSNELINKNFTKIAEDILQNLGLTFGDLKPLKENK
jgi:very-short-patch-repair endonuclease